MAVNAYLLQKAGSGWVALENKTTATDGSFTAFTAQQCVNAKGEIQEYAVRAASYDGASEDNVYVGSVSGESTSTVSAKDGEVRVILTGDAVATAIGSQHATLAFRLKDLVADGLSYDSGDTEAQTFETTGVVFTGATSATANLTVAGGGTMDVDLQIQAVQADTLFGADGPGSVLMFINGDVATWTSDGTSVKCDNGGAVKLAKSALTTQENDKYSTNEWVYQINAPITDDPTTHCEIKMKAQAAPTTPGYCPVITLVSRGTYTSATTGGLVQHSAVADDSSLTPVYTPQSVTIRTNVNSINGCGASA
jgi:hypothetical protein